MFLAVVLLTAPANAGYESWWQEVDYTDWLEWEPGPGEFAFEDEYEAAWWAWWYEFGDWADWLEEDTSEWYWILESESYESAWWEIYWAGETPPMEP